MTIPSSRRDELRRLVERFNSDNSSWLGAADEVIGAGPDLLDEIDRLEADAKLPRQCPICQCCETHDVPDEIERLRTELGEAKLVLEQQDRDLEKLRTALREAINWIDDRCDPTHEPMIVDRLRKVLG